MLELVLHIPDTVLVPVRFPLLAGISEFTVQLHFTVPVSIVDAIQCIVDPGVDDSDPISAGQYGILAALLRGNAMVSVMPTDLFMFSQTSPKNLALFSLSSAPDSILAE